METYASLPMLEDEEQIVRVTVLSVSGAVLLGPEDMYAPVRVSDLRRRVREIHHRPNLVQPKLMRDGQELLDGVDLEGLDLQLTAVYVIDALSERERDMFTKRLLQCSFAQDVNATFRELPERAKADNEVALTAIKKCGSLREANEEMRADKDIVLAAISQSAAALEYADPALQADEEVVLAAIKRSFTSLGYAAPAMRANSRIAIAAATESFRALDIIDECLFSDRAFVESMVELGPGAMEPVLSKAPPEVKNHELCLKAVQINGKALAFVGEVAKADEEIALTAIRQNLLALDHVGPELWCRRPFVLEVMSLNGLSLEKASPELRTDRDVVLAAVNQSWRALRYASDQLKADQEIVVAATCQDERAWALADPVVASELRSNLP